MIKLNQLSMQRQGNTLFADASLQIHFGQHVGVIGKNGCGKSSLFELFEHPELADHGDFNFPKDWPVAKMSQHIDQQQLSAHDYVLQGDKQLYETLQAINNNPQDETELAALYSQLEQLDGYSASSRVEKLLAGLGFKPQESLKKIGEFSGGWQMRLNLARCLFQPSQLMLLDEPTNHLDLDTTLWLQDWLQKYPGTLLLISHDREFLDAICDNVIHFDHQQLKLYKGNYSSFEKQRAEQLSQQQAAFDKQQERRKHLESFITRFKAKATKSKQAQSRIKAIEKMPDIAPAHIDTPFTFSFRTPDKLPSPLLKIDHATLGYGSNIILENTTLHLLPGQRIGLLGPNGAGKSTLIKAMAGQNSLLSGELFSHENLKLGYFAQQQMQQLNGEESPIWHLEKLSPEARHQDLLDYLGSFDFRGDRCSENVSNFSGGERARLVLALIIWQKPNVLLLDEPTNHLDLEMRYALTEALQSFEGAMLIVSHDRYLLQNTVDDFLMVANGRLEPFDGSLDDYANFLRQHNRQASSESEPGSSNPSQSSDPQKQASSPGSNDESKSQNKKEQRQQAAELRQKLSPITKDIKKLDKEIAEHELRLSEIETALSNSAIYEDNAKEQLQELLADQATIKPALQQAEERWLELNEQLEQLQDS